MLDPSHIELKVVLKDIHVRGSFWQEHWKDITLTIMAFDKNIVCSMHDYIMGKHMRAIVHKDMWAIWGRIMAQWEWRFGHALWILSNVVWTTVKDNMLHDSKDLEWCMANVYEMSSNGVKSFSYHEELIKGSYVLRSIVTG